MCSYKHGVDMITDLISQMDIDKMQFGFMPGCETTNAIFILRQIQKKYLAKKKSVLYSCRFRERF